MSSTTLSLQPVDEVQITTIMDNSFDMLMTSTEVAKRARLGPNPFERPLPIAEHGFSVLLRIKQGEKDGVVMFDTGLNPQHLLYNLDALEVRASDIQAVILSHGHADQQWDCSDWHNAWGTGIFR